MRLPVRSWRSTLARLGLRWTEPDTINRRLAKRRMQLEGLEPRQLMTANPVIDTLTLSSTSLEWGDQLTLTANDVSDSDGVVTSVAFYRDTNSDDVLQTGSGGDELLGTAMSPIDDGWSWDADTADFDLGTQRYFAVAFDNDSNPSDVVSTTGSVIAPIPRVIDDGDASFSTTGTWGSAAGGGGDGNDFSYSGPGSGSATASWTFSDLAAGQYAISTTWTDDPNRTTGAPYSIANNSTTLGTVLVNQQLAPAGTTSGGITWQSLQTVTVAAGTLTVNLNGSGANGYVIADAVRLVRLTTDAAPALHLTSPSNTPISDADTTPSTSDGTDFGSTLVGSAPVTRTFTIQNTGNATLNLSGTPRVSSTNTDDFTVTPPSVSSLAPGATTTFQVTFLPTTTGLLSATLTIPCDDPVTGDYTFKVQGTGGTSAVIENQSDAGYSTTGTWGLAADATSVGGKFNYAYSYAGGPSATATWTFADLTAGDYEISTTWVGDPSRANNTPYSIANNSTSLGTVRINQQLAPSGTTADGIVWQRLERVTVAAGTLTVQLSNSGTIGYIIADAVRVTRVSTSPAPVLRLIDPTYTEIADADTTPATSDGTDFGVTLVYGAPITRTFTIQNTGNATLSLNGTPVITSSDSDHFIVTPPATTSLASGATTTFQVMFLPTKTGLLSATVTIPCNDPGTGDYTFKVQGTGSANAVVDNQSDWGYGTTGTWGLAPDTASVGGKFNYSYPTSPSATATWTFSDLTPGQYQVYATWNHDTNRATSVPFSMTNNSSSLGTVTVNEQSAPSGTTVDGVTWQSLQTVNLAAGTLTVSLTDSGANGYVIADAVRLVRVTAFPTVTVTVSGTSDDLVLTLPEGANDADLKDDGAGHYRLRSLNASFETVDFTAPSSSLTIHGGTGDTLRISKSLAVSSSITLDVPTVSLNANLTAPTIAGGTNTSVVNVLSDAAQIKDGIALAAAGATINVAAGTYVEQLVLAKNLTLLGAGENDTIIAAPSTLATDPLGNMVIVRVGDPSATSTGPTVTIEGVKVTGPGPGTNGSLNQGIYVCGFSTLNLSDSTVTAIRDNPLSGEQTGVGILIGRLFQSQVGTAVIDNVTVSDYQKGGIVVDNTGSSLTITNSTVTGVGTMPTTIQNGIQISRGAEASVIDCTISNNSYNGGGGAAAGIVIVETDGGGITIEGNTYSGNQVDVLNGTTTTTGSVVGTATTGEMMTLNAAVQMGEFSTGILEFGSVAFYLDSMLVGTVAVTGNQASLTIPAPSPGMHTVRTAFSGSACTEPSEDQFPLPVNKKLAFSASAAPGSVAENVSGGTFSFSITATGDSGATGSVHYKLVDGTATSGQDFVFTSGVANFSTPGTQSFSITINDDSVREGTENFKIELYRAQGVAATSEAPGTTVSISTPQTDVNILDNEAPKIKFSVSAPESVDEDEGTLEFTITAEAEPDGSGSVHYKLVDGSAVSPADFAFASGEVSFTSSSTKTFTITINNDTLAEGTEGFHIELYLPQGAQATSSVPATVASITDDGADVKIIDDEPPVAHGDKFFTQVDEALTGNVLENDEGEGDEEGSLTAAVVSGPSHSASFTLNSDGSFDYQPATGYKGVDTFTYKASRDGLESEVMTVTINVVKVDLDTDSNNDGSINDTDDPIEEGSPGRFVALNSDDDDGNNTPDSADESVTGENDLVEVVARGLGIEDYTPGTLKVTYDSNIKLYYTSHKDGVVPNNFHLSPGVTYYVEGVSAGTAFVTWTFEVQGKTYTDKVSFTVLSIDLDVDSNNDNQITEAEDAGEAQNPGKVLLLNDDVGHVMGNYDLSPVEVRQVSGTSQPPAGSTLTIHYNDDNIQLYRDNNATILIISGGAVTPGETIYAGGSHAGTSLITLKLAIGSTNVTDTVRVSVARVDLDADSNNSGEITDADDPIEEQLPGQLIQLNDDDDDNNDVADLSDAEEVAGEDDLVELKARDQGFEVQFVGTVIVTYDDSIVTLYHGSNRGAPIASGSHMSPGSPVYAEGVGIGDTLVTWTYTVAEKTRVDKVRLTVAKVDIELDGLAERYETGAHYGAIVQRNSDFSKQTTNGSGVVVPDYMTNSSGQHLFDSQYQRDYTPAVIRWNGADPAKTDVVVTFDANILVWNMSGEPTLLTSGQAISRSSATGSINVLVEGIDRSSSLGGNTIKVGLRPTSASSTPVIADEARYTVVELNTAVDGNRDGTLSFTNEKDRNLLFWFNNDREGTVSEDYVGPNGDFYETDISTASGTDFSNSTIDLQRDLEDFAAWSVNVDPLLFELTSGITFFGTFSNPSNSLAINVFNDVTTDNAKLHALDKVVGTTIIDDLSDRVVRVAETFKQPSNTFSANLVQEGRNSFLFESSAQASATTGTLVFNGQFSYPDGRTKTLQSQVDLDLRDVDSFYDIFTVDVGDDFYDPDVTSFAGYDQIQVSAVNNLPDSGFNNDDYILLVHGWNMSATDAESFGETALKRLYWEGYTGRFGILEWPTFVEEHSPDNTPSLTFNASEFNAFRSGGALADLLVDLSSSSNVKLIAHSMGNVVAGEALRQLAISTNGSQVIDAYIAMEAAVAQSAYDTNGNSDPDDLYANALGSGIFTGGASSAGRWVNIYNPDDYALYGWTWNNSLKGTLPSTSLWPLTYSDNPYERIDENGVHTALTLLNQNGTLGPNAYEIMAFFAQEASDKTIGRDGDPSGLFTNVALSSLGYSQVIPDWDGRSGHSFQFHHTAADTHLFWTTIVTS